LTVRPILALLFLTLLANASTAGEFDRHGWYVGAGGGGAVNVFDAYVKNRTNGVVETQSAGTFNLRGGYRVWSWLALEGMYEGAYGYDVGIRGTRLADLTTHSLLGSAKLFIPTWRLQPYLMLGIGAQYGDFSGTVILDRFDTERWDFMIRVGLGLDVYLTRHWLVNVEFAPSVRFASYTRIPSESTDNVSVTLSGGIQYRF
jgi:hypothetical protein